jgi:short-subunit dehydrogenase
MSESKSIDGLHVLLTGATSGVGAAVFQELAARGAKIFATSRSQSKLDAIAKDAAENSNAVVKVVAADLKSHEEVASMADKAIEWFESRIDVLINNAGIGYHCPASNVQVEELNEVMSVNVIAPIMLTVHSLPALRQSAAPKIINISSFLGSKPLPLTAVYTASKHALNGFSKVLRLEESTSNISVTLIEPGAIDTPFIQRTHDPEALKRFRGVELEQLTPSEVARWVITVIESPPYSCPELIRIMPMHQAT